MENCRNLQSSERGNAVAICQKITGDTFKVCTKNEGKCWTDFCKYVKRSKGNRVNISAIKDGNGWLITDSTVKATTLNFYYSSVFSFDRSIQQIQCSNSGEPFAISTKIIRKRLAVLGKNKSVGPDSVSGEIIKLGGEAMIP
jgi:hypothetical protein